jgi:hypothetical protein
MARRRMIDPGFWSSEHNLKINLRQRLLFLGLISNADDKGRIKGNPNFLRAQIFPYDDITCPDITGDLKILADEKLVLLYNADNIDYIQITKWDKYQRIDRPSPSKIPAPDGLREEITELTEEIKNQSPETLHSAGISDFSNDLWDNNSTNDSKNNSQNDSAIDSWIDSSNDSQNHSCLSESKIKENKISENSVNETEAFHTLLHECFSLFHLTFHDPPTSSEQGQLTKALKSFSHMLSTETQYELVKLTCKKTNSSAKLKPDERKRYFFGTLKLLQQEECAGKSREEAKTQEMSIYQLAKAMSF